MAAACQKRGVAQRRSRQWGVDQREGSRAGLGAFGLFVLSAVVHLPTAERSLYFQNGLLRARSSNAFCASTASSSRRALIQPSANQACGCVAVHDS